MEERYLEIRFIYWIRKLVEHVQFNMKYAAVIEGYCEYGDINPAIIRKLIMQVRTRQGYINTYKEEVVALGRYMNVTYRALRDMTNIAISEQQRMMERINKHPELYENLVKHLPDDEFNELKKFMNLVDTIKEF